jgi:hypothetical protein
MTTTAMSLSVNICVINSPMPPAPPVTMMISRDQSHDLSVVKLLRTNFDEVLLTFHSRPKMKRALRVVITCPVGVLQAI